MSRIARLAGIALLTAPLSGCWFVFIPGSLIQKAADGITGAKGDHCVGRAAQVGDKVNVPGVGLGTIRSLSGESMRCTTAMHPIRAEMLF